MAFRPGGAHRVEVGAHIETRDEIGLPPELARHMQPADAPGARRGGAAKLHRDGGPRLQRRERGAAAPDERVRHGSHDLERRAASILRAERPHGSRRHRGGRGGGAAAADVDAADGGRPADGRAAGRAPSLSDASTPTALTAASVATTPVPTSFAPAVASSATLATAPCRTPPHAV